MGLKGAKARPQSTMAKSQAGALECSADLNFSVPRRKQVIRGSLPKEIQPIGVW